MKKKTVRTVTLYPPGRKLMLLRRDEQRLLKAYNNLTPATAGKVLVLVQAAARKPIVFLWQWASKTK